jgi:hypothetical protein
MQTDIHASIGIRTHDPSVRAFFMSLSSLLFFTYREFYWLCEKELSLLCCSVHVAAYLMTFLFRILALTAIALCAFFIVFTYSICVGTHH